MVNLASTSAASTPPTGVGVRSVWLTLNREGIEVADATGSNGWMTKPGCKNWDHSAAKPAGPISLIRHSPSCRYLRPALLDHQQPAVGSRPSPMCRPGFAYVARHRRLRCSDPRWRVTLHDGHPIFDAIEQPSGPANKKAYS